MRPKKNDKSTRSIKNKHQTRLKNDNCKESCCPKMSIENHLEDISYGVTETKTRPKRPGRHSEEKNNKRPRKHKKISNTFKEGWNRDDAERVLCIENELNPLSSSRLLAIRFPDPPITRDLILSYSPAIESVHFQELLLPRYCLVKLHESADVEETIRSISKIPFGTGTLTAELEKSKDNRSCCPLEDIDPCTLFVGNLSPKISTNSLKRIFPQAESIDLEHSQKMKSSGCAFVRFRDVETAISAFRETFNYVYDSRNLKVRFYRRKYNGDRVPEPCQVPDSTMPTLAEQESPVVISPEIEEIVEEVPILEVEDSKSCVLEDAARFNESLIFHEASPTMPSPIRIKTEAPATVTVIKTENEDQALEDRLYQQLLKSHQTETLEVQVQNENFADCNDEDRNDWDVSTEQKVSASECRLLLRTLSPIHHSSKIATPGLTSILDSDFACDDSNDPDIEDLFNELNPDDLDEEDLQFSS